MDNMTRKNKNSQYTSNIHADLEQARERAGYNLSASPSMRNHHHATQKIIRSTKLLEGKRSRTEAGVVMYIGRRTSWLVYRGRGPGFRPLSAACSTCFLSLSHCTSPRQTKSRDALRKRRVLVEESSGAESAGLAGEAGPPSLPWLASLSPPLISFAPSGATMARERSGSGRNDARARDPWRRCTGVRRKGERGSSDIFTRNRSRFSQR
jgi:hypothetical protein